MKHSSHPVKSANIKQSLQVICAAATMFVTASTSVFAFEGNTRFGCYAYVHDGCYVDATIPCSTEDYNWLLDNCDDAFPSSKAAPRPSFSATLPSQKVIKSSTYKKKIRQLKADTRRK